jgi:3-oxoacid CoA-transferase subunit B
MSFFNSAEAFAMIRGGHINVTVLGALQVSEQGDLANWMVPTRGIGNVGGAMDLAAGAQRIVAVMEHTTRDGQLKVVRQCSYPLTGLRCVDLLVTDLAVLEITTHGMVLTEIAPGYKPEEIQEVTEPTLIISPSLKEIAL